MTMSIANARTVGQFLLLTAVMMALSACGGGFD